MGLRLLLAALTILLCSPAHAAEVLLHTIAWPSPRKCADCTTLQFDRLEMQLPRADVGKIVVLGGGEPTAMLVSSQGDIPHSPFFSVMNWSDLLSVYGKTDLFQRHGVATARAFYEMLGKSSQGDRALQNAKEAELVAAAQTYTRAFKDSLHVFRIDANDPDAQRLHFVIDGPQRHHYMLAGPVSQALYEAILANLKVVAIP